MMEVRNMENDMEKKNDKGYIKTGMYTKRPLWQWIIFYVVVAGLAYGLIFYIFMGRRNTASGASPSSASSPVTQQTPFGSSSTTQLAPSGSISGSGSGTSQTTQPMPYLPAY
jgi:cytoskeletal protein RodZ